MQWLSVEPANPTEPLSTNPHLSPAKLGRNRRSRKRGHGRVSILRKHGAFQQTNKGKRVIRRKWGNGHEKVVCIKTRSDIRAGYLCWVRTHKPICIMISSKVLRDGKDKYSYTQKQGVPDMRSLCVSGSERGRFWTITEINSAACVRPTKLDAGTSSS